MGLTDRLAAEGTPVVLPFPGTSVPGTSVPGRTETVVRLAARRHAHGGRRGQG